MRVAVSFLFLAASLTAQTQPDWVAKSNENAKALLNVLARYSPEDAGELGMQGMDDRITILAPDSPEHFRRDTSDAVTTLQSRLPAEQNPLVKQDLEILIKAGQRQIHASEAYEHASSSLR